MAGFQYENHTRASPVVRYASERNAALINSTNHGTTLSSCSWSMTDFMPSRPEELYEEKLLIVQPILSSVIRDMIILQDWDCIPPKQGFHL